jgi:hypothetical protein
MRGLLQNDDAVTVLLSANSTGDFTADAVTGCMHRKRPDSGGHSLLLHVGLLQYRLPLNDERLGTLYGNRIDIVGREVI